MIQPEQTADGSYTLFVPELDEHYHSVKGARTESEHIFINMALRQHPAACVRILEIGFGTGLNAFLTMLEADRSQRTVNYTSIEKFPLDPDTVRLLHYPEQICPARSDDFHALHTAAWNTETRISPFFRLTKKEADFTCCRLEEAQFDIVYFDAFAPEKQPEMWNLTHLESLFRSLTPGGILTTYCAKGEVRRNLLKAGFRVERLPGPPGGKREILRAFKE